MSERHWRQDSVRWILLLFFSGEGVHTPESEEQNYGVCREVFFFMLDQPGFDCPPREGGFSPWGAGVEGNKQGCFADTRLSFSHAQEELTVALSPSPSATRCRRASSPRENARQPDFCVASRPAFSRFWRIGYRPVVRSGVVRRRHEARQLRADSPTFRFH